LKEKIEREKRGILEEKIDGEKRYIEGENRER